MRVKFETWFRGCLFVLVLLLGWSLWAGTIAATNAPTAAQTNLPPALLSRFEHLEEDYLTFGLDQIGFLKEHTFLGEPLWKYLASLIYILLAFYTAKFLDFVTRVWLRRMVAGRETRLNTLLLDLLHGPVKVVVFVLLLNVGLAIFSWSVRAKLYLFRGLLIVVAAALTYLAVKVLGLLLDLWQEHVSRGADRQFNDQLFSFLHKSLNAFLIIVAVLVTAQNLGINMTAAIASLSIGGLAVGLAAQDTLANLFGAIAVLADKPFRVGDQIRVDTTEGTVVIVGLRSTRVRSLEGHLVSVPNKIMGSATITNTTQRDSIKTTLNLALPHALPTEKIRRALALLGEIYRGHPMTQDAWISFNQFAGANINIQILHWWRDTDYQAYLAGMQEMNLAVKERFDAEGIGMV